MNNFPCIFSPWTVNKNKIRDKRCKINNGQRWVFPGAKNLLYKKVTFFLLARQPLSGPWPPPYSRGFLSFLDHTQRHTTVGRTPLDEWSARRRDLYLTTHNSHNRQTFMPPVGFFFNCYFIYCSDVYIDATWAQVLHLLCLVNPFNPFGTFEVLIIFRFTSVLLVSLRVVPFQNFKVSSCIGPACFLNLFPSSPFHEVYVVSEGEAPVVL